MPVEHYIGPVTGELKNWTFDPNYGIFWGNIYGDTKGRWPDGTKTRTSKVKKVENRDDCFIVITLNSVYRLWKCEAAEKKENRDGAGEARIS